MPLDRSPAYSPTGEAGTSREFRKPDDDEESGTRMLALRIDLHSREVAGAVAEHFLRALRHADLNRMSGMARSLNSVATEYPMPGGLVGLNHRATVVNRWAPGRQPQRLPMVTVLDEPRQSAAKCRKSLLQRAGQAA